MTIFVCVAGKAEGARREKTFGLHGKSVFWYWLALRYRVATGTHWWDISFRSTSSAMPPFMP